MLLRINQASVHYHKVAALKNVSMSVPDGAVVTIIGANGAGKTTTLRAISGLERVSAGEIWFAEQRIDTMPPEKIVALGVAHVPEGRRIFPDLTVQENLFTGAFLRRDKGQVARDLDGVYEHFPRLKERRTQWAKTLSGGEQQMLAMGRALMANPKLLLLDEPTMGLSPVLVQEIDSTWHSRPGSVRSQQAAFGSRTGREMGQNRAARRTRREARCRTFSSPEPIRESAGRRPSSWPPPATG